MRLFLTQRTGRGRCEKLDADEYCRRLVAESDDPIKTYWRAWSECHYLSCAVCRLSYPARDAVACQYHPERPEYFRTNGSPKSAEQPIGTRANGSIVCAEKIKGGVVNVGVLSSLIFKSGFFFFLSKTKTVLRHLSRQRFASG